MTRNAVGRAPLGWLAAGLLLGLLQTVAVGVKKPLGVSTQFVVADTQLLEAAAPDYVADHALINQSKYRNPGYGWWLAIGIFVGAAGAALATGRLKARPMPVWWQANHGASRARRYLVAFAGGFLVLMGARLAHGCTSGQFASGWAQLSVSALPFTIAMFGAAMLTARLVYPKTPGLEG
jgi:uncharacterized membrane protein YedE/YeeE